jgi:hypothetical protein
MTMRFLIVASLFGAAVYGSDDITIPLEGGHIVIRPHFIRVDQYGSYIPELSFRIQNQTSQPWKSIKLQFNIGGLCNGQPRQWSISALTSVGWSANESISNGYTDTSIPLMGEIDGCKTEIIKAALILAENAKVSIDGVTGELTDLEKQLQEIRVQRAEEAAAMAEEARKAAEAQAKKDLAEAARRKRIAAEQKKKDAELNARLATEGAAERIRAAEERRILRANCTVIYQKTVDMKVKDLTVREEQQVRACQALGLYPPR